MTHCGFAFATGDMLSVKTTGEKVEPAPPTNRMTVLRLKSIMYSLTMVSICNRSYGSCEFHHELTTISIQQCVIRFGVMAFMLGIFLMKPWVNAWHHTHTHTHFLSFATIVPSIESVWPRSDCSHRPFRWTGPGKVLGAVPCCLRRP